MSVHLGWHDDLVVRYAHSLGRAAVWGPAAAALILVLSCPSRATGQSWPSVPEFRPFAGSYIPAGAQRGLLDRAMAVGAQAALEFGRGIHAVAGFSWIPTERRSSTDSHRVEMAQLDLGAEWLTAGARGWRHQPVAWSRGGATRVPQSRRERAVSGQPRRLRRGGARARRRSGCVAPRRSQLSHGLSRTRGRRGYVHAERRDRLRRPRLPHPVRPGSRVRSTS